MNQPETYYEVFQLERYGKVIPSNEPIEATETPFEDWINKESELQLINDQQ